jgi:hypothetical protein
MTEGNNGKSSTGAANPKILLDPYMDWAKGEGIPIHLDFWHDLLALETGPRARAAALRIRTAAATS